MTILILEGRDEFLLKKIAEFNCQRWNFPKIIIDDEEDFRTFSFNQRGLFGGKTIIILENFLRKRFQKILTKIKPQLNFHEWIFLEIIPKDNYKFQQYKKSFYLPGFLERKAKKQNIDRLINNFNFWKKIANFLGVKISYQEWSRAMTLLFENPSFLWTALEQKKLGKNISLNDLILPWSSGNVFRLGEGLSQVSKTEVLATLLNFRKEKTKPEVIWYYLIRYFLQLYKIKRGLNLAVHPYALQKLKLESRYFTKERLERILAELSDLDLRIKTGFFDSKEKVWQAINFFIFSYLFQPKVS